MLQNPYGQGYIGSYAVDKLRNGCKVKDDAPFKSNALTNRFIDSGTVFAGMDASTTIVARCRQSPRHILMQDVRGDLPHLQVIALLRRAGARVPLAREGAGCFVDANLTWRR